MLTNLRSVRDEIAALPEVAAVHTRLATRVSGGSAPALIQLAPLLGAARVPVLAALAAQHPAPLLYVVPSSDHAQRAHAALAEWLAERPVLLFPAHDTLPYELIAPGISVLRQRLAVLHALTSYAPDHPPVIVAPVRAVLQPTLTPEALRQATITLQVGQPYAQEGLLRQWLTQGYQRVNLVQQPGELVRRGGLVDIWPTADEQPLRIEWFGDELDSLRRFDPASQRSEQRLNQVSVVPAYEAPMWHAAAAYARLAALDLSTMRPEARAVWEQMLSRLEMGDYRDSWAVLTPFFEQAGRALVEHLPPASVLACDELGGLAQVAHDWHFRAEEQHAELLLSGELPAAYPRPYLVWDELIEQTLSATASPLMLDLSNNDGIPDLPGLHRLPPLQAMPAPHFVAVERYGGQLKRVVQEIAKRVQQERRVVLISPQAARLQELLAEACATSVAELPPHLTLLHGALDEGWHLPARTLWLYTDTELFGWRQRRSHTHRQQRKQRTADERAAFLRGLKAGDYVVHIEHGIAVYEGLLRRTVGGIEREYLALRYAGGDRLYVPVDQVDRVSRYIGAGDSDPTLTRLGTQEWERAKRKARAAVRDLADDLLAIYARRQAEQGFAFAPDNDWQHELEESFGFIETGDQLQALYDVKRDMESPAPMDRLICGDVGFGKTEVALRAAFKAVQSGRQVAVLVPTTVLAQQHYTTFRERMTSFPIEIEMLSRFRSPREQSQIIKRLARGEVDMLIGTHRLLSKDVVFKDLGLLIIDEEQRFGVRHKERLKELRTEVDVLTLTATPIPRTLHMTLAGIRDMSLINTPPEDRIPIKTYVLPFDDHLIRDAIQRELDRGGQVYYVHNRVQSIFHVATHLQQLVPAADITVAHGQMDERQLEQAMLAFFRGDYDVLVCTTIIENGLDVPNANTIIIDDATSYGLAQLYQLRGRVGRGASRAYAYLFYRNDRPLSEEARQRLQAIQEATELGAGFRIAMRDLELRGTGNLLGAEQSGHIAAVGFDLYSRLLEQAVQQLKAGVLPKPNLMGTGPNGPPPEPPAAPAPLVVDERVLVTPLVTLDLPLTAYLPESYIPDESVRLAVYQRLVEATTPQEVQALRSELRDRFGELPQPVADLLTWLLIKALALHANVSSVVTTAEEFIIRLPALDPRARERLRRRFGRDVTIKVGQQFVRLDRRKLGEAWVEKLIGVLDLLGLDTPVTYTQEIRA